MADDIETPSQPTGDVFLVRGMTVMVDAYVAEAFGVETKRINEAVARNPRKFDASHSFQLTAGETTALRSQSATSNSGRGGARYQPRVFTMKGVARLATVLNSDEALRATDLILDTFMAVRGQIAEGRTQIEIGAPSRYLPATDPAEAKAMRGKLAKALHNLLDAIVDVENNRSVRAALQDTATGALANIRERLRAKGIENAKLEAETILILAQGEQVMAAVRKSDVETEGLSLDNLERRMKLVREIAAIHADLEAPALVQLLSELADPTAKPRLLSPPTERR